jgi:hypothetical protein
MSSAAQVQVAQPQVAEVFVDALGKASPPLAGLSEELTSWQLIQACLESREIGARVSLGRSARRALSALGERVKGAEEAGLVVSRAAGKLRRRAAREESESAEAKLELARRLEAIAEQAKELDDLQGLNGDQVEAELLVEAAAQAEALEASIRAKLEGLRDETVAGLRGVWGTEAAHEALVKVLIDGEESALSTLARNAKKFEVGSVSVDGREEARYAVSFVVPTRLAVKGSVGANGFVHKWVDGGWELMAGSVVDKKSEVTVGLYRLVGQKVNECAEIKAHIQTLMLKALEASAAGALHAVIAKGSYELVPLVHKLKHRTVGLAMYQLAIVADAESMTAELAETFSTIKVNMMAGSKACEAPRYFTLAMKRESGESGTERQGDEAPGSERQLEGDEADRDDESEVVGRMASVSAGVSRKRKSGDSGESMESVESIGVPVDEFDEAIEKAMESGRAGLDENAGEDTRIAFFVRGAERINGPGGLEEQIQAKVKAGEAGEAGGSWQLSLSCDDLSLELQELGRKQGNLRVAMQEATARVEASKVHSALVQMRVKRQRS